MTANPRVENEVRGCYLKFVHIVNHFVDLVRQPGDGVFRREACGLIRYGRH
jgi:hypothetical protein